MPVSTLLPTGAGNYGTNWAPAGAASNWQAVQPPDDDATTYTENVSAGQEPLTFATSDLSALANVIVTTTLTGRAFNVNAGLANENFYIRRATTDLEGNQVAGTTGTWTTGTQVDIARPGGGTWTAADINATEIGVKKFGANASAVRLSTLQWSVTWQPVGGGLVFLLLSLGPFVALTLGEMPGLARAIYRKTRTRLLPDEYAQAWRDLREYRFPRYYDLGSRP